MNYIDIVFDGPPDHNAPHFVEVEDSTGKSIRLGDWIKRDDGYWALRIPHDAEGNEPAAQPPLSEEALSKLGQAMLADYAEAEYVPSRAEIAMHLGAGAMATEGGAEHWADHEKFAEFVVARTDALLAQLSKPT